ncbi:MAG: YlqD family protein [Prochloraceae cyanobacterium]|nr:YlqD family protein [Prochloraceae cyanobacterium]
MVAENSRLLLKRPITVKVIVTPLWKEEVQQQLQGQISELDQQIQTLEMQGQKAIAELQQGSIVPVSPEAQAQIRNIENQVSQKKRELLDKKNQALQQMQQVQMFELDQEIVQGQMESLFRLEKGDNLVQKLRVEIVVRDGVVQEIRGDV